MTKPQVPTMMRQGLRLYQIGEMQLPGVTSILNSLAKPQLQYWAANTVAQCAIDELGKVADWVINDNEKTAYDFLKRAPSRDSGPKAQLGTDVHDAIEKINLNEDLGRVHPDVEPFIEVYRKFLKDFDVGILEAEATIYKKDLYAGTLDMIIDIDGETIVCDVKTGKGIYPPVALQQVAYARADAIYEIDGSERPLPKIDAAAALHLRPEGYVLLPLKIDDEVWSVFEALLRVSKWDSELSKTVIGKPELRDTSRNE